MSSTGKSEAPSKYGVRGLTTEQKQTWERLSRRQTMPTRYLKQSVLNNLELEDDLVKLSLVGESQQGINGFLFRPYPSFRKYTLEFLSSLRVVKRTIGRHEMVDRIEFRLANQNRVLTLADFDAVFDTVMDGDEENFNQDAFWKLITLEDHYISGTSKASAIRNPVLRLCHRGISNSIFARSDSGSINNTEIFLLYSLLQGKFIHLNQYVPLYWERVARNASGTICCGGHITAICNFFNFELNPEHILPGEMYLTYDVLHQMDVLKRDQNCYAYLYQGTRGDHFPLPSPDLTHIDGWGFRQNWRMDTPAHHRVVAAFPASPPWQLRKYPLGGPFVNPGVEVGSSHTMALQEEEEEEEAVEPLGASHRYQQRNRGRRRNQDARAAEFQDNVTRRLEQLHMSHTNLGNRMDERWDQQQAQWVQHQQWHGEWNQTWGQHQQHLNQWQQFQTDQWNAMHDRDMHTARVLEEVQRESRENREQLANLTAMMNQWNTNFFSNYPPHPPPQ